MDIEHILGGISIILTVIIAILGWVMQVKTEQIKIMENQLSDKKYNAYSDLVGLFFSALTNDKGDKSRILKSKMMEVKKNIFMYGSDSVVKAFNKWLCASADGTAEDVQFKYFLNLIHNIRKDMGGKQSKFSEYDLLLCLIQNKNEVDIFWNRIKNTR